MGGEVWVMCFRVLVWVVVGVMMVVMMMGGMVGMGTGAGGDEGIENFFFFIMGMSYDSRVIPLFADL